MNFYRFYMLLVLLYGVSFSCSENEDPIDLSNEIEVPTTYSFTRNNQSTVSFSGQTTRILMGEELNVGLLDFDQATETSLIEMYRNETIDGNDADPYSNEDLNAATKSIKSKVAASRDFFSANVTDGVKIKTDFENWIAGQVNEVFENRNVAAFPGLPGQLPDGSSTRYVNANGLEYNQMVIKGLIGALMTDQMLNNYLSTSVLDEADNRANQDALITEDGKSYTTMEHKWDEAYGYLYGTSSDASNPNTDLGSADNFLNKYLNRVENDADFSGIAESVFNAFKKGRAAIVAGAYDIRDEQAEIIRTEISKVIGIRAVYYLVQAKFLLEQPNPEMGAVFHDLSEAYGFIYSLAFTRQNGSDQPYFTLAEVDALLEDLLDDGENGLWDVKASTLDDLANRIADRFDFTVEQAGR